MVSIHFRVAFLLFGITQAIARLPVSLWEDMTIASTDIILSDTFYNEQTLNDAYEFEENLGSFIDDSYRISCLDYLGGAAFAKKLRGNDKSRDFFAPFRVDRAKNLSCFAIANSHAKKQIMEEISFTKSVVLPAPLKLHTSIYGLIENGRISNPHMVNQNYCIRIHYKGLSNEAIATLLNETIWGYNVSHFDTFFWTRLQSAAHLRGEMSPEQIPATASHTRSSNWRDAKKHLDDITARQIPHTYFNFWTPLHPAPDNDPCGFKEGFSDRSLRGADRDTLVFSMDKLISSNNSQLISSCVAHIASAFAQMPQVRLLAFTGQPMLLNKRARPIEICGAVAMSGTSADQYFADLKGQNVIVSIADTGVDETSCFFLDSDRGLITRGSLSNPVLDYAQRKIVQYSFVDGYGDSGDESSGHGSHVAGTIAGNTGNSGPDAYNGIASEAKLIIIDCASGPGGGLYPPSPADMYSNSFHSGGSIHSNSWGSLFSSGGYYSSYDTDKFLYDNPTFVIFFAAGNFGSAGPGSVSMESSAKNVVSVASSDSTLNSNSIEDMSYFSSIGPTYDGRIKPDITAPGNAIESVLSSAGGGTCETTEKSGTSMASPAAAAAAALVSQYFSDDRFWASSCDASYYNCKSFKPSGVLLKAAILHSGQQMASRGATPDSVQGYGRVHLQSMLPTGAGAAFKLYVEDLTEIQSGGQIQYNIAVSSSGPLKATLAWYDPPSVDGSTAQLLLHDLDLVATAPDGATYYGNGNGRDSVNVNEQVLVSQPAEGLWTFKVQAGQLLYADSQQYSIVITFAAMQATQGDDDIMQRIALENAEATPQDGSETVYDESASPHQAAGEETAAVSDE